MRIIINIDAVKDPDRIGKKTVCVRTGYYFSSGDELGIQNCGVEIYNILKEGFRRGFEGGLIIHEGEKK
ncbi:MAG: hypothetical protein IIZ06_05510 [Kiritimatiellae bacterium]|nr:hypothetical protein [Kiritimatiellia bacterium]